MVRNITVTDGVAYEEISKLDMIEQKTELVREIARIDTQMVHFDTQRANFIARRNLLQAELDNINTVLPVLIDAVLEKLPIEEPPIEEPPPEEPLSK